MGIERSATRKQFEISTFGDVAQAVSEARGSSSMKQPWFRGHANYEWGLKPTVFRDRRNDEEQNMVGRFVLRAPTMFDRCPPIDDLVGWLGLMRHYGLPTRLLDWTESILVALFFAVCEPPRNCDAAIWVLDALALNGSVHGKKTVFAANHENALECAKAAFDRSACSEKGVAAIAPQHVDLRYAVQSSMFTVHGHDECLGQDGEHAAFLQKFRIPHKARENLADTLRAVGIRRSMLFPDLSALAQELAES